MLGSHEKRSPVGSKKITQMDALTHRTCVPLHINVNILNDFPKGLCWIILGNAHFEHFISCFVGLMLVDLSVDCEAGLFIDSASSQKIDFKDLLSQHKAFIPTAFAKNRTMLSQPLRRPQVLQCQGKWYAKPSCLLESIIWFNNRTSYEGNAALDLTEKMRPGGGPFGCPIRLS